MLRELIDTTTLEEFVAGLALESGLSIRVYDDDGLHMFSTMPTSEFGRLEPRQNFSIKKGTWGAFELAIRYAYIDVTDKNVRGGQEGRLSTDLNWYLNSAVRMVFDWTRVLNAKNGNTVTNSAKGLDVFSYRLQITF